MSDREGPKPLVVTRVFGRFSPADLFDRLPPSTDRFLLESGANGPKDIRRWSFLGTRPFCTVEVRDGAARIRCTDQTQRLHEDPFAALDALLERWRLDPEDELPPFSGGFVGYFGYDAGRLIERLPATAVNDSPIPDIYLCAYDAVLAIDHAQNEAWVIAAPLPGRAEQALASAGQLAELLQAADAHAAAEPPLDVPGPPGMLASNFDRPSYRRAVQRARDYILAGDIFEVNLSQRFQGPLPCAPRILYERLRTTSPAPFSGMLDAGSFQILSSSPERFLRVQEHDGQRQVETRPIKGTRPRGATPGEDEELLRELLHSEKDQAELNMIVDLSRNDLGRVCQTGTVRVRTARQLERYANVHQAVAVIEGDLLPGATAGALLRATLPGGSITGAPKIRAMEIIEELEGVRRNAYCGSMGYIGFTGSLDLNIMIRTMVCADNRVTFGAGGAIVLDSDPDQEYEETLAKASAMLQATGAPLA